jgi:hypothetical protein
MKKANNDVWIIYNGKPQIGFITHQAKDEAGFCYVSFIADYFSGATIGKRTKFKSFIRGTNRVFATETEAWQYLGIDPSSGEILDNKAD